MPARASFALALVATYTMALAVGGCGSDGPTTATPDPLDGVWKLASIEGDALPHSRTFRSTCLATFPLTSDTEIETLEGTWIFATDTTVFETFEERRRCVRDGTPQTDWESVTSEEVYAYSLDDGVLTVHGDPAIYADSVYMDGIVAGDQIEVEQGTTDFRWVRQ